METGNKPQPPRCPLGAIQPTPMNSEAIKRAAWNEQGILVVSRHDERLSWLEQESVKQLGEKLHGKTETR